MLKKKFFLIELKNSILKIKNLLCDKDKTIFLYEGQEIDQLNYLKIKYKYFSLLDVQDDFRVGPSTASAWLAVWLKNKKVKYSKKNTRGRCLVEQFLYLNPSFEKYLL